LVRANLDVHVPEELVELLSGTTLSSLPLDGQVRCALAIHLLLTRRVSLGRAAELAGLPYRGFWDLLVQLDLPVFVYGAEDYEADVRSLEEAERRETLS
jgi:predicted HTH domain antitoxin